MMDRKNAYLTLALVRDGARERAERLTRATQYRRAQNVLARHAEEARAADMPADADGLDRAARYFGSRAAALASR
jgi:hypothetical protein